MDGITPFAMKDFSDDEIAKMNAEERILEEATHVTVSDRKAHNKNMKPSIPETATDFFKMIKRLGNFLHVLFGDNCPLPDHLEKVILAFQDCVDHARDNMSQHSKACMLWIILLQCREFSHGRFDILAEFEAMLNSILRKDLRIHHDECPVDMLIQKRPLDTDSSTTLVTQDPAKKQKKEDKNPPWHPDLKAALKEPLEKYRCRETGKLPTLQSIMKFCTGHEYLRHIKNSNGLCIPYLALKYCRYGSECRKKHATATDEQAATIKNKLQKFINNPDDFTQG